jgi:hypothetical protein
VPVIENLEYVNGNSDELSSAHQLHQALKYTHVLHRNDHHESSSLSRSPLLCSLCIWSASARCTPCPRLVCFLTSENRSCGLIHCTLFLPLVGVAPPGRLGAVSPAAGTVGAGSTGMNAGTGAANDGFGSDFFNDNTAGSTPAAAGAAGAAGGDDGFGSTFLNNADGDNAADASDDKSLFGGFNGQAGLGVFGTGGSNLSGSNLSGSNLSGGAAGTAGAQQQVAGAAGAAGGAQLVGGRTGVVAPNVGKLFTMALNVTVATASTYIFLSFLISFYVQNNSSRSG